MNKNIVALLLFLPLSMPAYWIINLTNQEIFLTRNFSNGIENRIEESKMYPDDQWESIDLYPRITGLDNPHHIQTIDITVSEKVVGNSDPFARTLKNTIDLTNLSDKELTRKDNPIIFNINPDFSITTFQEDENQPAETPEMPTAPITQTESKKTGESEKTAGARSTTRATVNSGSSGSSN